MGRLRVAPLVLLIIAASFLVINLPPAEAAGQIDEYMTGLDWPIALAFAPDGRIFFAERYTGKIRIIENDNLLPTPFFTLPDTATEGERGLLGLALDPEFETVPYLYVYQTYNDVTNSTIYNRIVRIRANGNTGVWDSVILRMPPLTVYAIHNGGVIAFGPDGKLYAVVGEDAVPSLAQDPLSPKGKVLRMNRDGSAPTDNPFYGSANWNNLVYTYGHRNMFGLAFHPLSPGIFVTENGPSCNDEINLLTRGANFGWGANAKCTTPPPAPNNTNQDGPSPVLPIKWWSPTICPTNAAIYGGAYFPAWRGDLFIGDCNNLQLHRLDLVPPAYDTVASDTILWTAPSYILEVEEGPDGAIWLTTPTAIYRYWDSAKAPVATFTATPNPVDVGVPVAFDASASSDADGTIISYAWNFGDGSQGAGVQLSHAYASPATYTVTLTVVDNTSRSAFAVGNVRVGAATQSPLAVFSVSSVAPVVGETVVFNASASFDADGLVVSYAWDFGDGATGSGIVGTHAYAALGTYSVALTVVDNDGFSDTAPADIRVNGPPLASFLFSPSQGYIGVPIAFDASASSDPDDAIVSLVWAFGDGTSALGVGVTHAYASKGIFAVTLTVTDEFGASTGRTGFVVIGNRVPSIALSSPLSAVVTLQAGERQTFSVDATDSDGDSLTYVWSVNGDVADAISRSFEFSQGAAGTYLVNVTVSDGSLAMSQEWIVTVVGPSSQPGALAGWIPTAILVAWVAVVAGILGWLWVRRKRRGGAFNE